MVSKIVGHATVYACVILILAGVAMLLATPFLTFFALVKYLIT